MISRKTLSLIFLCMTLSNAQDTACSPEASAACLDRANTPDVDFFGEYHGFDSQCYLSASGVDGTLCYLSICAQDTEQLRFNVEGEWYTCDLDGQKLQLAVGPLDIPVELTCPPLAIACPQFVAEVAATEQPSLRPSMTPTSSPTTTPTSSPTTSSPSVMPSPAPTSGPTTSPTEPQVEVAQQLPTSSAPSSVPSDGPSLTPSTVPSYVPSDYPSLVPSIMPTDVMYPTASSLPSDAPSIMPSGGAVEPQQVDDVDEVVDDGGDDVSRGDIDNDLTSEGSIRTNNYMIGLVGGIVMTLSLMMSL